MSLIALVVELLQLLSPRGKQDEGILARHPFPSRAPSIPIYHYHSTTTKNGPASSPEAIRSTQLPPGIAIQCGHGGGVSGAHGVLCNGK